MQACGGDDFDGQECSVPDNLSREGAGHAVHVYAAATRMHSVSQLCSDGYADTGLAEPLCCLADT